ncbi:pantoate--beta-alanine ligase [Thermoproteota archaeon]
MRIISDSNSLQREALRLKKRGKIIGFVPTMGFLHEGHLSLIRRAREDSDIVVVSIFVNPLQFGPKEDFKEYPRNLKRDVSLCKKYVDILFCPNARSLYQKNFSTYIEVKNVSNVLCGESRPGHFKGVATIVNKLFNIVCADFSYFGQKDAQQAYIIKRMVNDLNIPVKVNVLPIVREYDGLALSSRNRYLSKKERKDALVLYKSLVLARDLLKRRNLGKCQIIVKLRKYIKKTKSARVDYLDIVNPLNFSRLSKIKKEALVVLAVFIGKTRLIDNMLVRR